MICDMKNFCDNTSLNVDCRVVGTLLGIKKRWLLRHSVWRSNSMYCFVNVVSKLKHPVDKSLTYISNC